MGASLQIEFPAGMHIDAAAAILAAGASRAKAAVTGSFNGIVVRAKPGDEPAAIVAAWAAEMDAKAAAWRASPAGQAAAKARAAEVGELQARADTLAAQVGTLDFKDHGAVLAFLAELQPSSDRTEVVVRAEEIAAAFAVAGLVPNMCTGSEFDGEDEETFYRWLVGQALDGLTRGPAIHGIFHKFAAEWGAKWGRA